MAKRLSLSAVGHASSIFLALSFTLCVLFDLAWPQYAMRTAWEALLPGFVWLSFGSFLLGLVESYIYGWYFALVWVPLYNVCAAREEGKRGRE